MIRALLSLAALLGFALTGYAQSGCQGNGAGFATPVRSAFRDFRTNLAASRTINALKISGNGLVIGGAPVSGLQRVRVQRHLGRAEFQLHGPVGHVLSSDHDDGSPDGRPRRGGDDEPERGP